jgi:transposase
METRYVGLDVHREVLQACILDAQGRLLERHRFDLTRANLEAFVRERLGPQDRVVLEATTNTWAVVELIEPHVAEVVVGNPLRTRAIAEAKVKTDKVDAEVLAQLLRCDYLPRVWQPNAAIRRLRELTAHRAGLVADQTRLKNRIHSLLAQRLIRVPWAVLFSERGREWLDQLPLGESDRLVLEGHLRRLDQLEADLAGVEKHLAELSYPCEEVRLLMTLPGMGPAAAQGLWAALGDWRRFRDGDQAASYLGLVPSTRQSASSCRHGSITKAGNSHARWLLTRSRSAPGAARRAPRGVFPSPGPAQKSQRGRGGHRPQAGGHRLAHAQARRTLPLQPAGVDPSQVGRLSGDGHRPAAQERAPAGSAATPGCRRTGPPHGRPQWRLCVGRAAPGHHPRPTLSGRTARAGRPGPGRVAATGPSPPVPHQPTPATPLRVVAGQKNRHELWDIFPVGGQGSGNSVPRTPWDFSPWACSGRHL